MTAIANMHLNISTLPENTLVSQGADAHGKGLPLKSVQSSTLLGDAKAVLIAHVGERYMLSLTKQNKLLLTKVKQGLVI